MNRLRTIIGITFTALSLCAPAQSLFPIDEILKASFISVNPKEAPTRQVKIYFNQEGIHQNGLMLRGIRPEQDLFFTARKDELITHATLKLSYTPSPSLIPIESQLKIYLNEELMGVLPITTEQLGQPTTREIPLDARYMGNKNRLKIVFIGHYKAVCENPASSTLWVDVSQSSALELSLQTLALKNELANFPEPFFDELDKRPLRLPMVFTQSPNTDQQKAAAILASWFGGKAQWRGQTFPVLFNELPEENAIVFATNKDRPHFLKWHKDVTAPTVELVNHPNNPYIKLLLILGKDDEDLITATKGIAQGNILFRGHHVIINTVKTLEPRQPYDAPNWVRTDRPVAFAELQQVEDQLETSGIVPYPLSLRFNIPPDLYLNQNNGVNVLLKYRYTPPEDSSKSYLNVGINNQYIKSYELLPTKEQDSTIADITPFHHLINTEKNFAIPVSHLTPNNLFNFNFDYGLSIAGGTLDGRCVTFLLTPNHAIIDNSSTIDFSNYYHYLTMPNLNAFSQAGFPFSRMADLSETWVVMPKAPLPEELSTLLIVAGNIGAQTNYPALSLSITTDWETLKNKEADVLVIGTLPTELRNESQMNLLIQQLKSWVKSPMKDFSLPQVPIENTYSKANTQTEVTASEAISAIIEVQSPFYSQRSVVALLANNPHGFKLLNNTLSHQATPIKLFGSIAVIRDSGVSSVRVGTTYHVGHLPWWLRIWVVLQAHPISIGLVLLISAVMLSILVWRVLLSISRRRLFNENNE